MTAQRSTRSYGGDGAWRKVAFLLLAVVPVALVVPIMAARQWVLAVLVLGMLAGLAFMTVGGAPDDRPDEASSPDRPDEASSPDRPGEASSPERPGTGSGTSLPPWAPDVRPDPVRRDPDRPEPSRPSTPHTPYLPDRGVGTALGTVAVRPPRAPAPPGAGDRTLDGAADAPAVLDGGTVAGRSPWRLPDVQGHPGIAADAAQVGDLEVRAASIIGPSHRCEAPASPRQDAYALALTPSQSHLIVAVADGVSSSAHSDLGARVAVSAAVRAMAHRVQSDPQLAWVDTPRLFQEIAGEMVGTAQSRGIDNHNICSLLVVAAIPAWPGPDGRRRVWTAQVGDVSLWLLGPDGWNRRTGVEKQGLDRNNVGSVLPFAVDRAVENVVDVPLGHVVAVMTDGLGDVLTDVAGAQQFYGRRWARPPHPTRFVGDLCADARGQTDDRTAVAVWCGSSARAVQELP